MYGCNDKVLTTIRCIHYMLAQVPRERALASPRGPRESQAAMPRGANSGKGMGGRGRGKAPPVPQDDDKWGNHKGLENLPKTSLGMLKEIGHPSYPYLEWKFRCEILEYTTNLWPVIQGCSDIEALELWKDIASLLELDDMTWRHLMVLVHQGCAGRAAANKILWDLLTIYALGEHVELNHKTMQLIGQFRRILDRPPEWHDDKRHWTYERAIEPTENLKNFAAEMVPDGARVTTGRCGIPLAPPHCWHDARGHQNLPKAGGPPAWDPTGNLFDGGADRRASRRHKSWKPNRNKMGTHQGPQAGQGPEEGPQRTRSTSEDLKAFRGLDGDWL